CTKSSFNPKASMRCTCASSSSMADSLLISMLTIFFCVLVPVESTDARDKCYRPQLYSPQDDDEQHPLRSAVKSANLRPVPEFFAPVSARSRHPEGRSG